MSLHDTIRAITAAMESGTTTPVQIWIGWMGLIFLSSIFFVSKHWPARIVFLAMIATVFAVLNIWGQTQNIHLFGVAHILIWLPLSLYIWSKVLSKRNRDLLNTHRTYVIWAALLFATIVISLVFDVRDIFLVMTDAK